MEHFPRIEEHTPKMSPKIPQNGSQQRRKYCEKVFLVPQIRHKTAPLGKMTGMKIILCIWTTRIIPSKGYCKVSKQVVVFL